MVAGECSTVGRVVSSAGYPGPARALELYEAAIEASRSVGRKGVKTPYQAVNGHMFSFLDEVGRMALRLPEPMRTEFMQANSSTAMVQHGHVMKEYVVVPDQLLADPARLGEWVHASFVWVNGMAPKPTTRAKR